MEALTAVAAAGLTVYDMVKRWIARRHRRHPLDRETRRRSGTWRRGR